jgi:hypothetical protein
MDGLDAVASYWGEAPTFVYFWGFINMLSHIIAKHNVFHCSHGCLALSLASEVHLWEGTGDVNVLESNVG